jgi:adenylate cyclase
VPPLRGLHLRDFSAGLRHPLLRHPLWIGLAAAAAGWLLIQAPFWRHVELKIFDVMVVRSAPGQVALPITIVGIDEATFEALKSTWPLPRRHHARLLDRLREAEVGVVAFDIALSNATDPKDDEPFAEAIRRFGHVVLASDLTFRESSSVRQWFRVDPHPMFLAAGAQQGYSALEVDSDAVLRKVPVVQDSFWRAVLYKFDQARPGIVTSLDVSPDMRIRWLGGPHTFTYVPYHHLLEPEKYLPKEWKEFFRDNIVLVGRKVSVIGDVGAAQGESYQTPFYYRTREFMPRVEAHANLVANMATREVLRAAPASWALGAWVSAVFIALAFMRRWHPLRSGAVLALLAVTLAGMQYAVFARWGTWLPLSGAVMTVALIYIAQGAVAFVAEQRQRSQIKNAFSMYVSPALVDELIAHPERLKLGGERRHMTILFTDLAGFTTISEQLDAEVVSGIVNRHLSDMCEVILEHKGTVEKFLGDGIMAMWGAPVPDPDQHDNAVKTAIRMQQRMDGLTIEIEKDTGAVLKMRVGVNCGDCIVGNMGGNSRFDYTAVGDAVNLASRLEGVNKVYGTPILLSDSVRKDVKSGIRFREVDIVRVKGKNVGITVYTPCEDEALVALSDEALAAYRAGDLDGAAVVWRRLLDAHPGDPVARTFLDRIASFREEGLPEGWDGIWTLDTK